MKRINDFFTKNLGWKLLSLLLAIMLWFLIINIENPPDTKTYSIKVNVANEDKLENQQYVIANKNEINNTYISVKIKGNRLSLEALDRRKADMEAVADLQEVIYRFTSVNESISVPVDITLPSIESIEVLDKTPRTINVILEPLVLEERAVQVVTTGKPKNNFVALSPEITPENIFISGAKSNVDQVASVRVNVDLSDADGTITLTGEPKLYDQYDKEIETVSKNISSVQITIPIHKSVRVSIGDILIQGVPESGYTISAIEKSAEYIEVVGSPEAIDNLKSFELPVINVSGRSESFTESFDVSESLPSNISIRSGAPDTVTVNVTIEREIVKDIVFETDKIYITGIRGPDTQITVLPEPVVLHVKGVERIVAPLKADDIQIGVNVASYGDGTFTIPVEYTLPKGVTQLGDPPAVKVEIVTVGVSAAESEEDDSLEIDGELMGGI